MKYETREILNELKQVYKGDLNPGLISVKIAQSKNEILLITQTKYDELFIENLDIIADDDFIELSSIINPAFFNNSYTIEENTQKFIKELDLETIRQCFDGLAL